MESSNHAMEQELQEGFVFPVTAGGSPIHLPWQMMAPSIPPALPPLPPPPPPAFYGELYARRALTLAYEGDPIGLYMGPEAVLRGGGGLQASPFAELGKMTAQEIMDAKALAASKSHSEAERRRRERINGHLAKLRSLLPSTTKTDKASLLAEVIQHVKELKRQTAEIAEESPLPTESDEITVDAANDDDGHLIVTASLCCDDRSDLLPDLIKALKALRLRTLRAEITTLAGRVKNVLVITSDDRHVDSDPTSFNLPKPPHSLASIHDALRSVIERSSSSSAPAAATAADDPSSAAIKRQRTTSSSTIL